MNLEGFSKKSKLGKLRQLVDNGFINIDQFKYLLENETPPIELAENFIENAIGYFQLPLGIATNFRIDNKNFIIPMAVEETSIIAAASCTAKWINLNGHIKTEAIGQDIIGQIQFAKVKSADYCIQKIKEQKPNLILKANDFSQSMVQRGGGVSDIEFRVLKRPDGSDMLICHILFNPCNAMGANIINQICEALKPDLEMITGEKVTMCILSNLSDTKISKAQIVLQNIDSKVIDGIVEASLFAELDPYRAATNNKGCLNGMDALLIATGNDWRAVEAGAHAFAARTGRYKSLTHWTSKGNDLIGELEAPIMLGIVGGVTKLHPVSRICLQILNIDSSEHLARIVAAVGLVQNLGALKALSTVGIVEGHMKLHATNLALAAGAEISELKFVRGKLEEILKINKRITLSLAQQVLKDFRQNERAHI